MQIHGILVCLKKKRKYIIKLRIFERYVHGNDTNHVNHDRENVQANTTPAAKANNASKPKLKKVSINIGIDFGTSFTKVAFSFLKEQKYFIEFNGSLFKENIVYCNNNMLFYNKPEDNCSQFLYFKHSIIHNNFRTKSDYKIKTMPVEILVSAFFLACIIRYSKEYAAKYCDKKLGIQIADDCAITLGVPIDNYANENNQIFLKILYAANELSQKIEGYSCCLNDIDDCYQNWINKDLPKQSPFNTLPELYAESLEFLKSRNTPDGVYCLIDIGGGTVDMTVFLKRTTAHNTSFNISAETIKPLGIEVVIQRIAQSISEHKNIREYLQTLNSVGCNINRTKENELADGLGDAREENDGLKRAFCRIVMKTKEDSRLNQEARNALLVQQGKLKIIICGGGADYKWFRTKIQECELPNITKGDGISSIRITQEFIRINELFQNTERLNHRLIIAKQLSQRYEGIPQIEGFPWHFHPNDDMPEFGNTDNNADESSIPGDWDD